jgi:hypothetical protein
MQPPPPPRSTFVQERSDAETARAIRRKTLSCWLLCHSSWTTTHHNRTPVWLGVRRGLTRLLSARRSWTSSPSFTPRNPPSEYRLDDSKGSIRLDATAIATTQRPRRWNPFRDGTPVLARTAVSARGCSPPNLKILHLWPRRASEASTRRVALSSGLILSPNLFDAPRRREASPSHCWMFSTRITLDRKLQ